MNELKDIKTYNAKIFIEAIKKEHDDISEVVDEFYKLYPKEYVDDPNKWTDVEPVLRLFKRYKKFLKTNNPGIIYDIGINLNYLQYYICYFHKFNPDFDSSSPKLLLNMD